MNIITTAKKVSKEVSKWPEWKRGGSAYRMNFMREHYDKNQMGIGRSTTMSI